MAESSPTIVATFENPILAHISRSKLESNGIQATLDSEYHVTMEWMISSAVGGVKLLVARRDYGRAMRALAENEKLSQTLEIKHDADAIQCPSCSSADTYRVRFWRKPIVITLLLFGFPFPFFSRLTACNQCTYRWRLDS